VKRGQSWIRRYWQGALIAAAVSYSQLHEGGDTDVVAAQRIPYVWMLPERSPRFHEGEIVGHRVLTLPLEIDTDRSLN
jgi:hypothetical protein